MVQSGVGPPPASKSEVGWVSLERTLSGRSQLTPHLAGRKYCTLILSPASVSHTLMRQTWFPVGFSTLLHTAPIRPQHHSTLNRGSPGCGMEIRHNSVESAYTAPCSHNAAVGPGVRGQSLAALSRRVYGSYSLTISPATAVNVKRVLSPDQFCGPWEVLDAFRRTPLFPRAVVRPKQSAFARSCV